REHQRGTAARAPGLDVDDGDAGSADGPEHLVARRHARIRGPAEGGLEPGVARLAQRPADRRDAELGHGPVLEPAEGVDADAGDPDGCRQVPPTGANVYVTTSVPSSSVSSGASANRTGAPKESRAGSGSSMREITRRPSGSSTTPNPNGTSPR